MAQCEKPPLGDSGLATTAAKRQRWKDLSQPPRVATPWRAPSAHRCSGNSGGRHKAARLARWVRLAPPLWNRQRPEHGDIGRPPRRARPPRPATSSPPPSPRVLLTVFPPVSVVVVVVAAAAAGTAPATVSVGLVGRCPHWGAIALVVTAAEEVPKAPWSPPW